MLIKKVSINNFKGIKNSTITLEKGFNLLIGDNGVGKTSILEAISVGLGGFIAGLDVATKHFMADEIRIVLEKVGDGTFNRRYMTPVEVVCEAEVDGKEFTWARKKNSIKASRSTVEPRDISKAAFEMANDKNHILPVLSYQSAARMWMQKREASEDIFAKQFHRTIGYEGCLVEASNIKMLMNWIRRMEKIEWKKKEYVREYQGAMYALCVFMQSMMEEEVISVEYDDSNDELIFVTDKSMLPIRNLSAGYQSLIWMVLDIACRMALLNPSLFGSVRMTPGVVLIDELDMHLHPKWQWRVVEALRQTFPNVQFIAATHSPIVIASCKNETLIRVDDYNEIVYEKTPYGMDINDTLAICQDSSSMAKEIKTILGRFEECLDNEDLQCAEEIVSELKNKLGENHPKTTWAETALELEKIPLGD